MSRRIAYKLGDPDKTAFCQKCGKECEVIEVFFKEPKTRAKKIYKQFTSCCDCEKYTISKTVCKFTLCEKGEIGEKCPCSDCQKEISDDEDKT